jgi:hypothetical protein
MSLYVLTTAKAEAASGGPESGEASGAVQYSGNQ